MAIDTIPSWLQTNPQEWGQLAATGARLDLERQQMVNQVAAEKSRLAQEQQDSAMRTQIAQQQADREYQLRKQSLNITQEYKNLQAQQNAEKLQDAAKVAANNFLTRKQALAVAAQNAASKASEAASTAHRTSDPRLMTVGDQVISASKDGTSATPIYTAPDKPLIGKTSITQNSSGSQTNTVTPFQVGGSPQGVPPPSPAGGTPKPTDPQSKAALANQLAQQHPDWTRQQVIDAVNQQ